MVEEFPFEEVVLTTGSNKIVVRTFRETTGDEEFKWHWDDENRTIHPVHKTDWMFQMDNELPIPINTRIKIPKGIWHRIIKGTGDLQLIIEMNEDI